MATQLKLFAVKLARNGELIRDKGKVQYFNSKRRAKHTRDEMNKASYDNYVVVLGPDHKRFRRVEA